MLFQVEGTARGEAPRSEITECEAEPVLSEVRTWEERWQKCQLENTTGPKMTKGLKFQTKGFGGSSTTGTSPRKLGSRELHL